MESLPEIVKKPKATRKTSKKETTPVVQETIQKIVEESKSLGGEMYAPTPPDKEESKSKQKKETKPKAKKETKNKVVEETKSEAVKEESKAESKKEVIVAFDPGFVKMGLAVILHEDSSLVET
jgi:hypothetical protein